MENVQATTENAKESTLLSEEEDTTWKNISRSTERLEREWAKMLPLPLQFKSTTSGKSPHLLWTDFHNNSTAGSCSRHRNESNFGLPNDDEKLANVVTQPLQSKLQSSKHNRTNKLPFVQSNVRAQDKNLNANKRAIIPPTGSSRHDGPDGCFGRHRCTRRSRSCSHENLHGCKTGPLAWCQQHLVLKQTVKSCQNLCHTKMTKKSVPHEDIEYSSTEHCCRARALMKTCCSCNYNLKTGKSLSNKTENIEEKGNKFHERETRRAKRKTKPVKVDINVRLMPKSLKSKSDKHTEKEIIAKTDPDNKEHPIQPIESEEIERA